MTKCLFTIFFSNVFAFYANLWKHICIHYAHPSLWCSLSQSITSQNAARGRVGTHFSDGRAVSGERVPLGRARDPLGRGSFFSGRRTGQVLSLAVGQLRLQLHVLTHTGSGGRGTAEVRHTAADRLTPTPTNGGTRHMAHLSVAVVTGQAGLTGYWLNGEGKRRPLMIIWDSSKANCSYLYVKRIIPNQSIAFGLRLRKAEMSRWLDKLLCQKVVTITLMVQVKLQKVYSLVALVCDWVSTLDP